MRLLPEEELELVHRGRAGMRALRLSEVELLEASITERSRRRRIERRWRIARHMSVGVVAVSVIAAASYLYFAAAPSMSWGQVNPHATVGCIAVKHLDSLPRSPGTLRGGSKEGDTWPLHDRQVESPYAVPVARELKTDCPDGSDIALSYRATTGYRRWRTPFHATAVLGFEASVSGTCGVRAEKEVARGGLAPEWRATLVLPPGSWSIGASISARALECTLAVAGRSIDAGHVATSELSAGSHPVAIVCKSPRTDTGCDWATRQPRTVTAGVEVILDAEREW